MKFAWFKIERHILVRGNASPDDPGLRPYWKRREKTKVRLLPLQGQKIARVQDGRCRVCGASLFNEEEIQAHHLEPRRRGGTDDLSNLTLVHLYCHQQIHRGKGRKANVVGEQL